VWPHVLIGTLGFIFILAGVILLRLQVNKVVSAMRVASRDGKYSDLFYEYAEPVQENSGTLWAVLWTSVALMAVNPLILAVDGWAFSDGRA
jgi:hypothetical protein